MLRPWRGDDSDRGSQRRARGSAFEVTVHRTITELSDIDIAVLKDVHEMIEDRNLCKRHKKASWRAPGSIEARLWTDLCDALEIRNLDEEKDRRIERLQKQLASAVSEKQAIRKDLDDAYAECEDLRQQLAAALQDPGRGVGLGLGLDLQTDRRGYEKFVVVEIVHGFGADESGKFQQNDVVCMCVSECV